MAVCWVEKPGMEIMDNAEKCPATLHVYREVIGCERESGHGEESDLNRMHYAADHRILWLVTERGDVVIQGC